eukprot:31112_1
MINIHIIINNRKNRIIINKINQIPLNLETDVKDIDVSVVFGDIKSEIIENEQNTLQKLIFILQLYNNYIQSNVRFTFNWFLGNYLNINYIKILNDYHLTILNENNIDFTQFECKENDKCKYLNRHINNNNYENKKEINDNSNHILCQLLDNIHSFIFHKYEIQNKSKYIIDVDMKDNNIITDENKEEM